jgi:hypothetical protein
MGLPMMRRQGLLRPHGGSGQPPSSTLSVMIPAYFYPGNPNPWQQATSSSTGYQPGFMIANPNNGPGSTQQSPYVTAIQNAQSKGVKVIGYVATGYGTASYSPESQVKALVDDWFAWYAVDGIFYDECSSDSSKESYYQDLAGYVKSTYGSNKTVTLNPGTVPDEGYMNIGADIIMIYEVTEAQWQSSPFSPPSWMSNYAPDRFGAVSYECGSTAQMQTRLADMKNNGIKYIYITDDGSDGNPYDRLPSYYDTELTSAANS